MTMANAPARTALPDPDTVPSELLPLIRALARMATRRHLAGAQTPEPTR